MTTNANKKSEIVTGTDVLRKALRARRSTAAIAKELRVSKVLLEDLESGRRVPPPTVLQALTTFLFGGMAVYDEKVDRLRSANVAQPTSMGVHPPRYVPPKVDYPVGTLMAPGPQPLKPEKPKAKPHRPGWAQ